MQKLNNDFFESVIIYNSLTNETYLSSIIDVLNPNYFKSVDIKSVITIITDFYKQRNSIPNHTEIKAYLTTEELKTSFKKVVTSFKNLDKKYNQEELYQNTERFLKEKAVYNAVIKTVNEYSEDKVNIPQTLEIFEKACGISLVEDLGLNYFKEIDKHCEQLKAIDKRVSTGWKWLDKNLGGGYLENGRAMYIFTGFTNVGKSIFLANTTTSMLKQNKCVVLITLEMPEDIYASRIDSQLTKIKNSILNESTSILKSKVVDFSKTHPNAILIIKEFPPKTITCNHIKSFVKKLINKNIKPDALVVDYVNLINPPKDSSSSYENIKAVAEQLRAMSYIFKCPMISASQINRAGAKIADPGMELVSESMGLPMTSDAQFSIWQDENDKDLGIINLGMQKNRFGPNYGSTKLKIDYDTFIIEEIEDQFFSSNETLKGVSKSLDKILEDSK